MTGYAYQYSFCGTPAQMGTILGVLRLTPERLEEVERDEAVYWRADEEAEYGDDLIDIDKA